MAKTNINFNNKTYSIENSLLADATARLEAHLISMMGGSEVLEGDGQEFHKFAPAALTFRSTAPLNELQEVQINGVAIDPSNYTTEEGSTVITLPIEYLNTLDVDNYEISVVSENKSVSGGFSVVQPELNEYGFYYNQPYTAYIPTFGGKTVFFMRNDGTMDVLVIDNGYAEVCSYAANGNNLIINAVAGTFTGVANNNGIYCNELASTFTLGDESIVADNDYIYAYKEEHGGYEVTAIDKTKAEYGAIKTGVNGIGTVALGKYMFASLSDGAGNKNMTIAPKIPDTVTVVDDAAFIDCTNLTKVILPESVTTIGDGAFYDCTSLTSINIPPNLKTLGSDVIKNSRVREIYITNVESWCLALSSNSSAFGFNNQDVPDVHIIDNVGNEVTELITPAVATIPNYAFNGCEALKNVVINDFTKTIRSHAFDDCKCLTSVTIGENIEYLEEYLFRNCDNLMEININSVEINTAQNITGKTYSGVFSNIDNTNVNIDKGIDVVFGDKVVKIPKDLFYVVPRTDSQGDEHYDVSPNVKTVTIGKNVTSIGAKAFCGLTTLTAIIYKGTVMEWSTIEKGDSWNLHCPATHVHCTDGDVAL